MTQEIVNRASILKNKHTDEAKAPVNYACIFSQSWEEYDELLKAASIIGKVVKETPNGKLFQIPPLVTSSGRLQLLRIRIPDSSRPERGDADFTVSNYLRFKQKYLAKRGFKLIPRENFEMIELMDADFDVRAYFSHPPLDEQLCIKSK
ncbi:hypothetical protein A3K72_01485 [Candidatus Woesearchaeota archaeon RBG_13_36_6]|nr:MAG: hypothetical protein A3K72_01485 [Candidatus Woesearchaeota archaeon RBG_13_36_6]